PSAVVRMIRHRRARPRKPHPPAEDLEPEPLGGFARDRPEPRLVHHRRGTGGTPLRVVNAEEARLRHAVELEYRPATVLLHRHPTDAAGSDLREPHADL